MFSICYWANYTQGQTKLSRKSENAVVDERVLKFLNDSWLTSCWILSAMSPKIQEWSHKSRSRINNLYLLTRPMRTSIHAVPRQCWSVFKIQVFKLLLKILYMYLVFSILNTFPVFILWLVLKLLFGMYLVFCSLQNQNTFFKILLNNNHVVYDYFDYFGLVIIHS